MSFLRDHILADAHLTAHAVSTSPAWLWSADGSHVLWANAVGAAVFGANAVSEIQKRVFAPEHPAAAQVARMAATFRTGDAARLQRVRGFGAGFGRLLTCLCSRLSLQGNEAILIVAAEPAGPNLPLADRVGRLLAGETGPIAAFSRDGDLTWADADARQILQARASLGALGVHALAAEALDIGTAAGSSAAGDIVLSRLGAGPNSLLLAQFALELPQPAAAPSKTMAVPSEEALPNEGVARPAEGESVRVSEPARDIEVMREAVIALAPAQSRHPLRFIWQMDEAGRFDVDSPEFNAVIGDDVAGHLGHPWHAVAAALDLDPEGHILRAIESRETWSGIPLQWPVEGSDARLPVELSGLPVFDRERVYRGYRGFGVCRDVARIAAQRGRHSSQSKPVEASDPVPIETGAAGGKEQQAYDEGVKASSAQTPRPLLTLVPQAKNVLPFPSSSEHRATLSAVERNAFVELAERLNQRLTGDAQKGEKEETPPEQESGELSDPPAQHKETASAAPIGKGVVLQERRLLDQLPQGILIYRHDQFIYANPAFLNWVGHDNLFGFAEAGGLDTLFIEDSHDSTQGSALSQSLLMETPGGEQKPTSAKLMTVDWEDATAMALILGPLQAVGPLEAMRVDDTSSASHEEVQELKAILDTATDGVILLDAQGRIRSANRSAQALFGYEQTDFAGQDLMTLFAPESARVARQYLEGLVRGDTASLLDHGREVTGIARSGGSIPLSMTMGRLGERGEKFCAVFRDIMSWKKAEADLQRTRNQAEKASSAKSEFIAKLSHQIRTPLSAIIGFSAVMMDERFGPIGNERYHGYLKDIHDSGEHLLSLLNDLLDLSKIEAGTFDLNLAALDLNDIIQQCVAIMQPQANRGRVIVRTSLPTGLPQVTADPQAVRQMLLNLLSNSIKFTPAGGQVIVSTALSDQNEVVLRIRDTGIGMNEKDVAAALEPFRQLAQPFHSDAQGSGLGLPLTKALAEANRARFSIKSAENSGTLVEVAFPATRALAAE